MRLYFSLLPRFPHDRRQQWPVVLCIRDLLRSAISLFGWAGETSPRWASSSDVYVFRAVEDRYGHKYRLGDTKEP